MYKIDTELNDEILSNLIKEHKTKKERYQKLKNYYLGKFGEKKDDKLIIKNAYPRYITDMHVGYFMGDGVNYTCDDDTLMQELNNIFSLSNEKEENYELARICSIKGKAYELVYIDENSQLRFNEIEPEDCFLISDNTIDEKIIAGVRLYGNFLEVYTNNEIRIYKVDGSDLKLIETKINVFNEVPIIEYLNNKDEQGDFEQVIELIEAYNTTQTNTLRDMTDFTDAYLKLVNLSGTSTEDIQEMKKNKILLLNEQGEADWLVKNVNDSWVENYKNRLRSDIHKFSYTPDLSDDNFGNNLSGISIRYKILSMEQLRANKERKFEMALQRRLKLIFNYLNLTKTIQEQKITITFNNTLPQNVVEIANIINSLSSLLSEQTLISQLPFINNAKEEMERKKAELQEGIINDYER